MKRNSIYPVLDLIIERWSPRAMSGESISDTQLMTLFEAARWAPSSYNNQPWRFIYAKRETPQWQAMFDLLVPFNQSWAKNGAVLVTLISHNAFSFNQKPSRTHSFDTGAAWENLCLQAQHDNLVVHGMEGFDYDKAKEVLHVPDSYTVEMMFVIGKPGERSTLSEDLQKREEASDRLPLEKIISEGVFRE